MTFSPYALLRPAFYTACGSALLFTAAAHAGSGSGTIEFKGEIIGQTCEIDVAGSGVLKTGVGGAAARISITLDKVGANSFGTLGSIAGKKNFEIKLTKCGATAKSATLAFDTAMPVPAGSAKGVTFAIFDGAQEVEVTQHAVDVAKTAISGGDGTFSLAAAYKSTEATVTPGDLKTTVPFTLSYQ